VLDLYDIKTRFLFWDDDQLDYEGIFWEQAPRAEQACVLLDRRMPGLLGWLNQQGVPYVVQSHCAYRYHDLPAHDKVYVNKVGGSFQAAQHLLELGHRRIGFAGRTAVHASFDPEHEGVSAALRCVGLDLRPEDVLAIHTEVPEIAEPHCRQFLERPDRPTAVVADNGPMAIGLLNAAAALGLRVPEDLSVIGFDTPGTAAYPRLSTIVVPRRELARTAVRTVLQQARGLLDGPQTRVLHCELDLRESTGPAPV
jgi:LacI family transcriptional regulator